MIDESAQTKLATILLVFIIVVGVCGNLLNMIIFSKRTMIKMSTFKFLFYLSLIDFFVLMVCTTDAFLTFGFNLQIRLYSDFFCRWHSFFTYFLTHMSSCCLMVVSIERCLVICNLGVLTNSFRFSRKQKKSSRNSSINNKNYNNNNTSSELSSHFEKNLFNNLDELNNAHQHDRLRKRLKYKFKVCCFNLSRIEMVMFAIAVLVALANLHCLLFLNLNMEEPSVPYTINTTNTNKKILIKNNDYTNYLLKILSNNYSKYDKLNMSKELFISKAIYEFKNLNYFDNFTANKPYKSIDINNSITSPFYMCFPKENSFYGYFLNHIWIWIDVSIYSFIPSIVMIICSIIILTKIMRKTNRFSSRRNSKLKKRLMKRNKQLLLMLSATNLYFLCCSLPYCITYTKMQLTSSSNEKSEQETSFIDSLVHIFAYSNNSVNFIFYSIFSQKYRQTFVNLFPLKNKILKENSANLRTSQKSKSLTSINLKNNAFNRSSILRDSSQRKNYNKNSNNINSHSSLSFNVNNSNNNDQDYQQTKLPCQASSSIVVSKELHQLKSSFKHKTNNHKVNKGENDFPNRPSSFKNNNHVSFNLDIN